MIIYNLRHEVQRVVQEVKESGMLPTSSWNEARPLEEFQKRKNCMGRTPWNARSANRYFEISLSGTWALGPGSSSMGMSHNI